MRHDSHEIIVDNDVIIEKRLDEIDTFLSSDRKLLMCEAYLRQFGRFSNALPVNIKLNTGLYGMPPGFDLASKINSFGIGEWEDYFDEQGATSLALYSDDLIVIPLSKVSVNACPEYIKASHGTHFVGINRGWDGPWNQYLNLKLRLL